MLRKLGRILLWQALTDGQMTARQCISGDFRACNWSFRKVFIDEIALDLHVSIVDAVQACSGVLLKDIHLIYRVSYNLVTELVF